jgi:N-acyl-D-aspartate/D-glutamate deacylase
MEGPDSGQSMCHHRVMPAFDLLIHGGTVIDGNGTPGRRADVGVLGDRIAAIGDLSAVPHNEVGLVLDVTGRAVAPGFIDPHGHSDGSVLLDGALASHLHQGFTTQLSGNCGESLAPVSDRGRELLDLSLRPHRLVPTWATFGGYLDRVGEQALGPNVAFLVGHGTVRGAVLGAAARPPDASELAAMIAEVEAAMDAGALGLSSGLIYAPGMHAAPEEIRALVAAASRRGGLYATHMRNEAGGLLASLEESVAAVAQAGSGARLQVSHLKCGARSVWGRAAEAIARLEEARRDGLDVGADQYPYTAAATTLATILPAALQALGVDAAVDALRDRDARAAVRAEIARGRSGWENVAADPGWDGVTISFAASHPDWSGRSLAELATEFGRDPADVAFDALVDDHLDVAVVIHCMRQADVETIMTVPWIAVCTDAEGRRPGHPILDAGRPHPRTYGTTARVLGTFVRELATVSLETAVAKLTAVPAARLGLRDRGSVREGAFADLVVFDPLTVRDEASYLEPVRHPSGIEHVIVNGRPAILSGSETGERAGRLLRGA